MNAETLAMEKELKEAGWRPLAAHPDSPVWRSPEGQLYPTVGYSYLGNGRAKGETTVKKIALTKGYVALVDHETGTQERENITKLEALQLVTDHINRPGVIDVETLMQLFEWQQKLCYWLIRDLNNKGEQHHG